MSCLQACTDWPVKISSLNTGTQLANKRHVYIDTNTHRHFKLQQCAASLVGWLLQTHLGSLEVGDPNSVRNIRTCGSMVRIILESEVPVSASYLPLTNRSVTSGYSDDPLVQRHISLAPCYSDKIDLKSDQSEVGQITSH